MAPFDEGGKESCGVDDDVGMVADWFAVGTVRTSVLGAGVEGVS